MTQQDEADRKIAAGENSLFTRRKAQREGDEERTQWSWPMFLAQK